MNAADTAALACLPLNVHCCHIRWKASQQAGAEGSLSDLTLKDKHGQVIEKQLPGGKVKKKAKNEIILETNTRSRKKCVTTILGVHPKLCLQPDAEPIPQWMLSYKQACISWCAQQWLIAVSKVKSKALPFQDVAQPA